MPLMHIEPRLLVFTKGVRLRIAGAVAIGLLAVSLGIARLGLLGWLIGQVFLGRPLSDLVLSVVLIAAVMVARGWAEHWRAVVAHETAARVQKMLRRTLYDRIAALETQIEDVLGEAGVFPFPAPPLPVAGFDPKADTVTRGGKKSPSRPADSAAPAASEDDSAE